MGQSPDRLANALLAWYDHERRDLPWRAPPGVPADPYRVWISEIMLQQTTAATVAPFFHAFVARWPCIQALAAADLDEVLHAWQGLGYYARARNLHACARLVAAHFGGCLPANEDELRQLPGIGTYTAAAIAAIAFDRLATPVDGNVLRVVARLRAVEVALPRARSSIVALAVAMTPEARAGDFAQAMMDLGATVCTPRRPRCGVCPWADYCAAHAQGVPETFPRRPPAPDRPVRHGVIFWAERLDGSVLIRQRSTKGLLGGMIEFPSTPWRCEPWRQAEAIAHAPLVADWALLAGSVRHTFTHFHLELAVVFGRPRDPSATFSWCHPDDFSALALPTLMKKVVAAVRVCEQAYD
ncbi:MAG: A/G-specific adenine glycosylase [Rhodospirillales bacterium]|nr:A/G-specific adenine glycosylase [Rhodospirillales bacterium]